MHNTRSSSRSRARVGRPRLDASAPSVPVCVRLTVAMYNSAYSSARAERLSVAAWLRRAVVRQAAKR